MKTNRIMKIAVTTGLVMGMVATSALAGGPSRGRSYDRHNDSHYSPRYSGDRYHHNGDSWVKAGWFGFGAVAAVLTAGAIVDALPSRHTTVIVKNEPYYYYDGTYFRPAPSGYVVVPAPVVVQQPVVVQPPAPIVVASPAPVVQQVVVQQAAPEPSEVTVNIPTATGVFVPVTLRRTSNGFIGPQGEYYPEFPKVEQLKLMYGK